MAMSRRAVYPGSFNPPTSAHLAIADAVRRQRDIATVTLTISTRALAKESVERPLLRHRLAVVRAAAAQFDWLEVALTEAQLLADIAEGFDVIVMGADKWHQINDPFWYDDDPTARDAAISRLPEVAVAPRPPLRTPTELRLELDDHHADVSSTLARSGALHLMAQAAQHFALETGAWIEPERYERWLGTTPSGEWDPLAG